MSTRNNIDTTMESLVAPVASPKESAYGSNEMRGLNSAVSQPRTPGNNIDWHTYCDAPSLEAANAQRMEMLDTTLTEGTLAVNGNPGSSGSPKQTTIETPMETNLVMSLKDAATRKT